MSADDEDPGPRVRRDVRAGVRSGLRSAPAWAAAKEFRSILVHLDAGSASSGRLKLAQGLADRFDARVTVLFGIGADAAEPAFAYSTAAALRAAAHSGATDAVERASLQAAHEGHRGDGIWCDVGGDLVQAFVAEAAYADLLILGLAPRREATDAVAPDVAEAVMLRGRAPTLVVPHPQSRETLGEQVLIAWDGSLPAARAVRAAAPLLRRAAQVDVVSWSRLPPRAPFSRVGPVQWLERHGIASRLHQRDPHPQVGDAILVMARELQADLIVMGCHGHGPLREPILGGAARAVLASLPVPALLAH